MFDWKTRLRAAGIHLGISLLIAGLAALLVFGLWYPYPYREISGGRELFLLVVAVDVVLGPLITFSVFSRTKPRAQLRLDLVAVGLIQLAALAYGLWTVHAARPVHLVFEYHRFRVVHAVEVPPQLLPRAAPGLKVMPLSGPTLLSLRPFKDARERDEATMMDIQGQPLAARADLWQPYEAAHTEVLAAARPVTELKARFPLQAAAIDEALKDTGLRADGLAYVPMIGRKTFWTVFIDPSSARVLGFLPLDSF
ncbi:MAG: TfpX/TfpZ family type IV pilin accessory protein [Burkholderiaceae bacterium]|nr:TfpX/TfpZ family type IV pilin accessory protein [Burkholderiaceae bacterium]